MTDTAPQIMQSRQLATTDQPAMQTAAMARMDAEFRMAQAIARAGADMLPRAYRDKPGAVILVQQWANAHEVDILTAMQTVAFVEGRPVIDATMQRAMAGRAGYDIEILEADRTHAVVQVTPPGKAPRTASYTWADAETAGLTGKNNWKKNPEDMLVARATTRALKRHAPEVMLGFVDPDDAGEADMVEVLTANVAPAQDASGGEAERVSAGRGSATPDAEPQPTADDVLDVEVVEDTPPTDVEDLKALIGAKNVSTADTIREAQAIAKRITDAGRPVDSPSSVAKIAAGDPEVLEEITTWLLTQPAADTGDEEPF